MHCRLQEDKDQAEGSSKELIHYVSTRDSTDSKLETKSTDSGIHSPEWDKHFENRSPHHFYSGCKKDSSSPQMSPRGYPAGRLPGFTGHAPPIDSSPETSKIHMTTSDKVTSAQVSPTAMSQLTIDEHLSPPMKPSSFTTSPSQGALYMPPIFQVPGSPVIYRPFQSPTPLATTINHRSRVAYTMPKMVPAMYYPYYGAYMATDRSQKPFVPVQEQALPKQGVVQKSHESRVQRERRSQLSRRSDPCRLCLERVRKEKLPYPPPACVHKRASTVGHEEPLDLSLRTHEQTITDEDVEEGGTRLDQPLDLSTKSKSKDDIFDPPSPHSLRIKGKAKWDTPKYRAMSEYYRSLSSETDEERKPEKYSKVTIPGQGEVRYPTSPKEPMTSCRENFVPEVSLPMRSSLV